MVAWIPLQGSIKPNKKKKKRDLIIIADTSPGTIPTPPKPAK